MTSRDAELGGDFDAVQRPGAAERDQTKVARVDAFLHGARADRVGHVGVNNRQHALGGVCLRGKT